MSDWIGDVRNPGDNLRFFSEIKRDVFAGAVKVMAVPTEGKHDIGRVNGVLFMSHYLHARYQAAEFTPENN